MRRRGTAIFFLILGISLSVLAVALNVGWILLNLREAALLVLGVIFFALIITGLILNTIFLVREIRRNEQHDAFLNAVTHELKTPIASIRLYLETLKSRELTPEKRAEFYDIMLADNDRLLATVDQVLVAGKMREKSGAMNLTEFDLGELIEETVGDIVTRRHLAPASVKFAAPDAPVKVLADRNDIRVAISNLLDNAIKYSRDEPKVSVRLRPRGARFADISVRDNGIGLLPADLKRIFKRFYRAANSSGARGTGLGLAIVRSIAEKHGGKVTADSRGPGQGSTFRLQLPRINE
jgi:two-component system, OmpR family, sensor histidine kinase SenX3